MNDCSSLTLGGTTENMEAQAISLDPCSNKKKFEHLESDEETTNKNHSMNKKNRSEACSPPKNGYPSQPDLQSTVLIQSTQKELIFNNPTKVWAALQESPFRNKVVRHSPCTIGKGYTLKIEVENMTQNLENIVKIGSWDVKCWRPIRTQGSIFGRIYPISQDLKEEEILKAITIPEVFGTTRLLGVKRLYDTIEGGKTPSPHVRLQFSGELPTQVIINEYMSYNVAKHTIDPLRCPNCLLFGHSATSCRGKRRCPNCSEQHESNGTDNRCGKSPYCIFCGENHNVRYRNCPTTLKAIEIEERKQKTEEGEKIAREQLLQLNPTQKKGRANVPTTTETQPLQQKIPNIIKMSSAGRSWAQAPAQQEPVKVSNRFDLFSAEEYPEMQTTETSTGTTYPQNIHKTPSPKKRRSPRKKPIDQNNWLLEDLTPERHPIEQELEMPQPLKNPSCRQRIFNATQNESNEKRYEEQTNVESSIQKIVTIIIKAIPILFSGKDITTKIMEIIALFQTHFTSFSC